MTALHDHAVQPPATTSPAPVSRAGVVETLRLTGAALAPMLARGIILRRPPLVRLADRLQLDDRAVRALQASRRRHGDGPLLLRVPGRSLALVLSARDAGRVLAEGPTPFSPATREKRAALQHFQPRGVLISPPEDRPARRAWNETALQLDVPLHAQAASVAQIAAQELSGLRTAGRWDWEAFAPAWWRVVRRLTLGDAARDDEALTDLLGRLRSRANWAFLRRTDGPARAELLRRLDIYVQAAEPGSLAATVAALPADPDVHVADQIAHWLFAWDAAGIATFRALALLAGHPAHAAAVASEVDRADPVAPDLPLLRATVLESVRLWPTTLAVLRESTQDTTWAGSTVPAGTTFVITSSLAHRDDELLPDADRFAPQLWADDDAPGGTSASLWSMVPFSAGPARCPGRDLVLYTTGVALSVLTAGHRLEQAAGRRVAEGTALPRSLDHTALAYRVS
ncbi:cytochrome P450 [Klenkia brasiliensis]|uniref:Cytochrome P450 n=1 Tax=Klenkia brasiliensis TaxID=333142 RepID=A0A1G7LXZ0_9ACTN|nr:cytochrome P450 [Klenkia brasiliensis]SDF53809.1 Cytochrome P450 [Klenkia brasiliensis]